MPNNELRDRYVSLFGEEPAERGVLGQIESKLGVVLPNDFKEVASFYSGGIVGGISHHAIATSGPASNIVEETARIREAVGLPPSMVVIAEPPTSLIVLNTQSPEHTARVIWCDATDASRLSNVGSLHDPQIWRSYAEFFGFLLERELEERDGQ